MKSLIIYIFCALLVISNVEGFLQQRRSGYELTPLLNGKLPCSAEKLRETEKYACDENGEIICMDGWSNPGKECIEPVCLGSNGEQCDHGRCIMPHICACEIGWDGPFCDQCIPLPRCDHGSCNNPMECNCDPGWYGAYCHIAECSENCSSTHGFCREPGDCECMTGWSGEDCDQCKVLPSCIHGTCLSRPYECHCDAGYMGPNCDIPQCSPNCSTLHGYCNFSGECLCKPGWYGDQCNICIPNLNECTACLDDEPWSCDPSTITNFTSQNLLMSANERLVNFRQMLDD